MLLEWRCRQGEGRSGAPVVERNEPHESSPLLGLEEIKFERGRRVSKTGKVKGEMKMKEKRGLYKGVGGGGGGGGGGGYVRRHGQLMTFSGHKLDG